MADGVREVSLTKGMVAIIDEADWPLISQFKWYAHACSKTGKFRASTMLPREFRQSDKRAGVSMHRMLMGYPSLLVDHRDRNPLNNRRSNLRLCNSSENGQNRTFVRHTSRFKGVSWQNSSGRWVAQLTNMGRKIWLGRFTSEVMAAIAYDAKAHELGGEFATLNFPESHNGHRKALEQGA